MDTDASTFAAALAASGNMMQNRTANLLQLAFYPAECFPSFLRPKLGSDSCRFTTAKLVCIGCPLFSETPLHIIIAKTRLSQDLKALKRIELTKSPGTLNPSAP